MPVAARLVVEGVEANPVGGSRVCGSGGEVVLAQSGIALRRELATRRDKSWLFTREMKWADDKGYPANKDATNGR